MESRSLILESILLDSYKNYSHSEFSLTQKNLIIGSNGTGKTHILQAIYDMCLGRFSDNFFGDTISQSINISLSQNQVSSLYRMHSQSDIYSFFLHGKKITRKSYLETLPLRAVMFTPIDMNMLYLSPSYRRDFLDNILLQAFPQFSKIRTNYTRSLKQRNTLLKNISEGKGTRVELDFWDEEFARNTESYMQYRIYFVSFIEEKFHEMSETVFSKYPLTFHYSTKIDRENVYQSVRDYLFKNRERDILIGHTYIGPHLDDFSFFVSFDNHEKIESISYLSRGENKMLLLFLKKIEVLFIEKILERSPILLFDDVFSELDTSHAENFLQNFSSYQMCITAQNYPEIIKKAADFSCINLDSV